MSKEQEDAKINETTFLLPKSLPPRAGAGKILL